MLIGNLEVYGVIYKITNKVNKKVYIGQTVEGFNKRYGGNVAKYSHNSHLKNSIKKYGILNFEIIKIFDVAFSKEELGIKEDFYIKLYKTTNPRHGYNKRFGGIQGKLGFERRENMKVISARNWLNNDYRKKVTQSIRKITSTEQYRNKMSVAIKNSSSHKSAVNSKKFRKMQSESHISLWKDANYRNNVLKKLMHLGLNKEEKINPKPQKNKSYGSIVIMK